MNLIYIHTHDTGRFIEPYGYQVPTPHLTGLAKEGTLFRQAYCAAPTCSPSRAAMLTGTTAHTCGITGLVHRGFALADNRRHLAHYLRESGFDTILCGVQHETAGDPGELGYHHVCTDHPYAKDDFEQIDHKSTADAVRYLKSVKKQPFFLSLGFVNTHRDYPAVGDPTAPDYVAVPPVLPDNRRTREDFARYIDSARIVDDCCQKLFDTLTEEQLWQDTVIIFTTDHGIAFPKMKCSLYDTGIGVSLILKYPGNPSAGTVIDALISQLDIYPTLCDLLGIVKPAWLEGSSILPLLNREREEIRDAVFAEVSFHSAYEPMRCVRTGRYKLIQRFDNLPGPVLCNVDDGSSKDLLITHGWQNLPTEAIMLFDLIHDPAERCNLAKAPEYQTILSAMQARLREWMEQTDDPLLKGPVKKPDHARINRQSCISNTEEQYI